MIEIRLDVDYAYPSRFKSFFYTALGSHTPHKNYLKNSKILAKMINESPEEVMAYWFFTPYTMPDKELLDMLHQGRHEVALHVATDPYLELKRLEKATGRKVQYYTVHGTARLIARIIWKRKLSQAKAPIPEDFPLKSFYDYPTLALDWLCHRTPPAEALKIAQESIAKGEVQHIHPEWLFQRGTRNPRGPYYQTLKALLGVDKELDGLAIKKKWSMRIARYSEENEYLKDAPLSERFLEKLGERGIDAFTFVERKWCCPIANPSDKWLKTEDNIALLKLSTFEEWWQSIGKKTRNMIRKSEKTGVKAEVVEPSDQLAEGIWKIYNETPIRQGRSFSHYGWLRESVRHQVYNIPNSKFTGAFLDGELVGFVQLIYGDQIVVMAQILSLQKHWDKAVNNALVAKAVEVASADHAQWLMYGRMGNHPSLDSFKESNGFVKFTLTRYYVLLTGKAHAASKLGLHREAKDLLPDSMKGLLIPLFNWISRTKVRLSSLR